MPHPLLVCSGGTTTRCAADGHLTLDLRKRYKEMIFDHDQQEILIGAGTNMGDLIRELSKYKRSFPIGLSRLTGLGYILTGGISPLSRSQGLAVDQIIEIKGLWGNGENLHLYKPQRTASLDERKTWNGLCGAAAFLAIITHIKLKTTPVKPLQIWHSTLNQSQLIEAIEHAEDSPNSYSLQWIWRNEIFCFGVNIVNQQDARPLYESLLKDYSFKDKVSIFEVPGLDNLPEFGVSKRKEQDSIHSEVISLTGNAWGEGSGDLIKEIAALMNNRPHPSCYIAAQQLGGVINKQEDLVGSFIDRDAIWKPWITAAWPAGNDSIRTKSLNWLENVWNVLMKKCPGVHMAQMHPHLDWHEREMKLAFKDWLPELKELKAKYDPDGLLPHL